MKGPKPNLIDGAILLLTTREGCHVSLTGRTTESTPNVHWFEKGHPSLNNCYVYPEQIIKLAIARGGQYPWIREVKWVKRAKYNPQTELAEPYGEMIPWEEYKAEVLKPSTPAE